MERILYESNKNCMKYSWSVSHYISTPLNREKYIKINFVDCYRITECIFEPFSFSFLMFHFISFLLNLWNVVYYKIKTLALNFWSFLTHYWKFIKRMRWRWRMNNELNVLPTRSSHHFCLSFIQSWTWGIIFPVFVSFLLSFLWIVNQIPLLS